MKHKALSLLLALAMMLSLAACAQTADHRAVHGDLTLEAVEQAQDAAEQGTLAHAVGAQHREKPSLAHGKADVLEYLAVSVGEGEVFDFNTHVTSPPFIIR